MVTWLDLLLCPSCGHQQRPAVHTRAIREGKAELDCERCGRAMIVVAVRRGIPERALHPVNRGRECWLFAVEVDR